MPITYAQKSSTVQKAADSNAASVLDSSSQSESLQRKADMVNGENIQGVVQMHRYSSGFKEKHLLSNGEYNSDIKKINEFKKYSFWQTSYQNSKALEIPWISSVAKKMNDVKKGKGADTKRKELYEAEWNKQWAKMCKELNAYEKCLYRKNSIDGNVYNSVTCEEKLPNNDTNLKDAVVNAECINTCCVDTAKNTTCSSRSITNDAIAGYCHLE